MIRLYTARSGRLEERSRPPGAPLDLEGVIWIDLVSPTAPEEVELEEALGIDIPTRADMAEIEASSRLYSDNGALFMTASILSRPNRDMTGEALEGRITALPATFVLTGNRLVTVRYHEPRSFHIFRLRAEKGDLPCHSAKSVLIGLYEVIVDRLADIAEDAAQGLDDIASRIFDTGVNRPVRGHKLDVVLDRIGRAEDLNGKLSASLGTMDRLVTGLSTLAHAEAKKEIGGRLKVLTRDLRSVIEVVERQSVRITFLLDSTLGRINIEQNGIIKIFSVMSVIFLPPTLIASVYGMNFEHMPELDDSFGYPLALFAMVMSAALPYLFFRRKGWL